MIPTSTGAAKAVGLVLPALKGKLDGTAIRVPTANVSLIDFEFDAARDTSREEVNALMEKAAESNQLRGILGINKAATVSVDFNHDPHSATFDVTQTQVLDKRFVRVLAWYDNELGILQPHDRGRGLFRPIWLSRSIFYTRGQRLAKRS